MIVMSTAVPTSKKKFHELYEDEVIFAPLCNGAVSVPVWWKLKSCVSIFEALSTLIRTVEVCEVVSH